MISKALHFFFNQITKVVILVFFVFIGSSVTAQLQISQNGTVAQWVTSVLLGQGISVSNITYTGSSQSIGLFATGNTTGNLGISAGVVLSTGKVVDLPGNASVNASTNTSGGSDSSLANLITQNINDAAVLEFDFVPSSDTIEFNFVFGSEEYPEYVNSFNDVFGFFITGINPTGSTGFMYNDYNIALVPGTTNTPVSIYNVNNGSTNSGPCTNCQFYVNNSSGNFVKLDGFTTVLKAVAAVYPCSSYHIKIAIGDAGDHVYDSGVFLEMGSFSSTAATLFKSTSNAIDTVAVEGCTNAIVSIVLPDTATYNNQIAFSLSGTAVNGVDYVQIMNNFVTIPAGQISADIVIQPIYDYISEPLEYVDVLVYTSACTTDSIRIQIKDNSHIELNLPNDTIICSNDTVLLNSLVTGSYSPYSYLWSVGDTLDSIIVVPNTDTIYKLQVFDACGNDTLDSIFVFTSQPVFQPFNDTVCYGDSAFIGFITPETYSYNWANGQQSQFYNFIPTTTMSFPVNISDSLGCTLSDTLSVEVKSAPIVQLSNDTIICKGSTAILKAQGNYSFLWSTGASGSSITVSPIVTTDYSVIVTDISGCYDSANVEIEVLPSPTAIISIPVDTLCRGKTILLEGSGGDQYFWSTGSPLQNINVSPMLSTEYTLTVTNVANATHCSDDTTVSLIVERCNFIYTPSAFTPNQDGLNDQFGAVGLYEALASYRIIIYNRWGEKVFESTSPYEKWDGTYKGQDAPQDVYSYIIIVEELQMEPYIFLTIQ